MIYNSNADLDENNEEILPPSVREMPHVCLYADMDRYVGRSFPWHWHGFVEINYIQEGSISLSTVDGSRLLHKGDVVFVNSNVPHTLKAEEDGEKCANYTHLFDAHFLSGMYNAIMEEKYLLPILKSKNLSMYAIVPDTDRRKQMIRDVLQAVEECRKERFGYEFRVRELLCRFWCMLLEETEELRSRDRRKNQVDIVRVKSMMQYVYDHFTEKLTLEMIAQSANISARECTRCFQRCIGIPPIKFLNDYRVRMAAVMLCQTDKPVMDVGEDCGFSSNSYFGKVFRETLGCTPKEYRKK